MKARAQAIRDELSKTYAKQQVKAFEDWLGTTNDLSHLLFLLMRVAEVEEPDGSLVEVTDGKDPRPRHFRLRTPEEYGTRGGKHSLADLERVVKTVSSARALLTDMLPPGVGEPEPEADDERLVLRVVSQDQVAELGARFGRLVDQLREVTEQRKIERGLDDFGEPIKQPALDAPGRDMLEIDEEQGPVDDDDEWEWIEVDDPGTLPPGVYMNDQREILPINGPHPDDEGEWESGVD